MGKKGKSLGNQNAIKTLFTGSSSENNGSEIYDIDEKKNYSKVPILIEETDSSQFSTIVDAMNGENLAVQGPPGTGKSTTIANIIASYLFDGKKVLVLNKKIKCNFPVELLHGVNDSSVSWFYSIRLIKTLISKKLNLTIINDGDHSLSRAKDLKKLDLAIKNII